MAMSRRRLGWILGLILLAVIFGFLSYPYLLIGTIFELLFTDMAIAVIVVLFAGMFFLLTLILYLGVTYR